MSTELVRVPFHGHEILAVKDDRGEFVVIKPLCEQLGIDARGQAQRIQRAPWGKSAACMIHATGTDGKTYEMFCLSRKRIAMWLATLDVSRVREEVRSYLEDLQNEAADVLDAYFTNKKAGPVVFPVEDHALAVEVAGLRQRVYELTRHLTALPTGTISTSAAESIRGRIRHIAEQRKIMLPHIKVRSLRRREEQQIRNVVGLANDLPWEHLPQSDYVRVSQELYRRERDSQRDASQAQKLRQASLLGVLP